MKIVAYFGKSKTRTDSSWQITTAQEYKRAVEVYNSVTTDWIQSWRNACDIFQDMEEKRIGYIHNSLWAYVAQRVADNGNNELS